MIQNKFMADPQLKTLIENSATLGHRCVILLYNEKDSREQVMIIHHLISKFSSERPNILWCHKKHSKTPKVSKKVLKEVERKIKSGECNISTENAFNIFLLSTPVTFNAFADTEHVLGKTFGMCVIQDFEGLTPNILCRVAETVKGGGAIVFLLPRPLSSLRDMFQLKMDIHSKLQTYSHKNVHFRFNKRLVLSLGWCKSLLVLDKDMKVRLELKNQRPIKALPQKGGLGAEEKVEREKLKELLESLSDGEKPLPQLANLCCTMDQAKCVLQLLDVVTDKEGRSTVTITAGRGRGKSAALGLATAAAIFFGVNNIYVTSPSPANLNTFFEFLFKGFDSLDYVENSHYDIISSTNPEFGNAVVRVNVFARHRQVIQYVSPCDSGKVSQAELVVIDEAAAIPLQHVKQLIGGHNVFMASTIKGYEGTGRSLSLKLVKELRQQTVPAGAIATHAVNDDNNPASSNNCRSLRECHLETSIRHRAGDPVEKWLERLFCLGATNHQHPVSYCPHADTCALYYVNRDVLLSGHPTTESFLLQVTSLLVSSHYKNSPNDLHILADSPSHHLFVLIHHPVANKKKKKKRKEEIEEEEEEVEVKEEAVEVFCVVQVCVEGSIPPSVSSPSLERGESPEGDLIPWTLASHFLDPKLTQLKGVRVVRVATHPDYQSMGYGSRALNLLKEYYEGRFVSLEEEEKKEEEDKEEEEDGPPPEVELIGAVNTTSPLLTQLRDRSPEQVAYIGVSYGLTHPLFRFWKRQQFLTLHISPKKNKITGEHNCIMVHPVTHPSFSLTTADTTSPQWLKPLATLFLTRFTTMLGHVFSHFTPQLACGIISSFDAVIDSKAIDWFDLEPLISGHDLHRLQSYSKNLCDRHLITDMLPHLAALFFGARIKGVHLSDTQAELLVGCGLQHLPIEEVGSKLNLPIQSTLGQFNRAIKRVYKALADIQEESVAKHFPKESTLEAHTFTPVTISLEQDLEETGLDYQNTPSAVGLGNLSDYAIKGDEDQWSQVLAATGAPVVTIKSTKRPNRMTEEELERELNEPKKKKEKFDNKKTNFKKNKTKKYFLFILFQFYCR